MAYGNRTNVDLKLLYMRRMTFHSNYIFTEFIYTDPAFLGVYIDDIMRLFMRKNGTDIKYSVELFKSNKIYY